MGRITYYKFWDKLRRTNIKQTELKEKKIISGGTLDKLRNNECVTTDTIVKLCDYLDCDITDILEYEKD